MRTIRIPQPASFALLHWLRNSPETDFPRSDPLAIAKASRPGNGPNLQDLPSGQPYHRSEEHTSELQSLMRISYAVFCLKKKNQNTSHTRELQPVLNTTYLLRDQDKNLAIIHND